MFSASPCSVVKQTIGFSVWVTCMMPEIIRFSPEYAHTVDGSEISLKVKNAVAAKLRTSVPLVTMTLVVSMSDAVV